MRPHETKAKREARQREERWRRQSAEDFRWMLSHPQGRRVLWSVLQLTGLFGKTFDGTSGTYHQEGRRSVGVDLMLHAQGIDPALYGRMITERMDALTQEQVRDRAAAARRQHEDEA